MMAPGIKRGSAYHHPSQFNEKEAGGEVKLGKWVGEGRINLKRLLTNNRGDCKV